jgi:energy-coupling factor transporter ATP-binding protein EcfA2
LQAPVPTNPFDEQDSPNSRRVDYRGFNSSYPQLVEQPNIRLNDEMKNSPPSNTSAPQYKNPFSDSPQELQAPVLGSEFLQTGHHPSLQPAPKQMEPKMEFTVLLIGRTGSGKSTFVNIAGNLMANKSFTDERIISIDQVDQFRTEAGKNIKIKLCKNTNHTASSKSILQSTQTVSQTTKCTTYTFTNDQYVLNLIDTPGLCDTKGEEADKQNLINILSMLKKYSEIHAVCLMYKNSDFRIDKQLKLLFDEIKQMLTDRCKENLIICFTFAPNSYDGTAMDTLNKMEISISNPLYFENKCLFNLLRQEGIIENQSKQDYLNDSENNWKRNKTQFDKVFELLNKMVPFNPDSLIKMSICTNLLSSIIAEQTAQIDEIVQLTCNIEDKKTSLLQNKKILESTNNFQSTKAVLVPKKVKKERETTSSVDISPNKATVCTDCNKICHKNCSVKEVMESGNPNIKKCRAFNNESICKICHHGFTAHIHRKKINIMKKEIVEITEYEQVQEDHIDEKKKEQYTNAEKAIELLEDEIKKENAKIQIFDIKKIGKLKIILYLYQKIKTQSIGFFTEHLIDHINIKIKALEKDPSLSAKRRALAIKVFEDVLKQYRILRGSSLEVDVYLNEPEKQEIANLIDAQYKSYEEDCQESQQSRPAGFPNTKQTTNQNIMLLHLDADKSMVPAEPQEDRRRTNTFLDKKELVSFVATERHRLE